MGGSTREQSLQFWKAFKKRHFINKTGPRMLHIALLTIVQFKNSRNLTFHDEFRQCVQIAASRFIELDELKANFVPPFLQTALNQYL